MERDRIRRIYDRRAAIYDRTVGLGERVAVGDFRRAFGAELRGRSLEVAVGSGLNLPYYTPAVTHAVGVDLSGGMLREAKRRSAELGLAMALFRMDAEHLAFADGSFDTVAISLALCTVPDPEAALREMARVCRRDGKIVFLEHVRSPVGPIALIQRIASPLQTRFIGCHLDRCSIDVARSLGFVIDEERSRLAGIFRLAIGRPPAL